MKRYESGNKRGSEGVRHGKVGWIARREPHSLAGAVEAAVTALVPRTDDLAFAPAAILALLAGSYARQIYSSASLAAALRDRNVGLLQNSQIPDASFLRQFRCDHRKSLAICLQVALRFLARQKIAQGMVTHVSEVHLAEEANRRIIMAMFVDNMEAGKDQSPGETAELCYLFANAPRCDH